VSFTRRLCTVLALSLVCARICFGQAPSAGGVGASAGAAHDPGQTWSDLQRSFPALDPPPMWHTNRPAPSDLANWKISRAHLAAQLADQCRDYYSGFPDRREAALAREAEYNLIEIAVNSGNTNLLERLMALDHKKLSDPSLTSEQRFDIMVHSVQRNADCHEAEGIPVVMGWLERGSRQLLAAFPDNPEAWQFLVTVADQEQDPAKARRLAQEIISSKAAGNLKMSAGRILRRLDHLGKPIPLQGVGLNGERIDLARMKGNVVLLHFWDTDCGYCLEELPEIQSAYDRFHTNGLEIIGVNFDPYKTNLVHFLARHPIGWPQYLAGAAGSGIHGNDFDVPAIPTLWLVDRRGNLCDLNARENLSGKIERLLRE
jgi:thiol-disulfide isomerase/thioredoxin